MLTHLYLVEVLSRFEGHYIVGRDPNYWFVCRIFCFIERQRCLSRYNLQENFLCNFVNVLLWDNLPQCELSCVGVRVHSASHPHGEHTELWAQGCMRAPRSNPSRCPNGAVSRARQTPRLRQLRVLQGWEPEPGRPQAGQTRRNSRRSRSAGAGSSTAARRARPRWTSPSAGAAARAAFSPAAPRRAPRPWFRPAPSPADTEAERPRSAPPGARRGRAGDGGVMPGARGATWQYRRYSGTAAYDIPTMPTAAAAM